MHASIQKYCLIAGKVDIDLLLYTWRKIENIESLWYFFFLIISLLGIYIFFFLISLPIYLYLSISISISIYIYNYHYLYITWLNIYIYIYTYNIYVCHWYIICIIYILHVNLFYGKIILKYTLIYYKYFAFVYKSLVKYMLYWCINS